MKTTVPKPVVRYFVSYAHGDGQDPGKLLKALKKELGASAKYQFQAWQDTDILVGEKWDDSIQRALQDCAFGLLLVSPSFLGSKYITDRELPLFVDGAKPCVPVALCPIDFENHDLKGLETRQIYRFAPPASDPKSFVECNGQQKKAFVHQLFGKLVAALDKFFAAQGGHGGGAGGDGEGGSGVDEAGYKAHIRKHYRQLQIDALGGDHPVYRDIELQQVFVPQDVRSCGDWLPEALEVPAPLTLHAATDDPDLKLAEWHEHRKFRDTKPTNIFDVLRPPHPPHRVVLGAPGAGKSSLTRIRLLAWAKDSASAKLPVLVELRRFHRSGREDFLDYLENDKDLIFRFATGELRSSLKAGTAELIFDGLDEVFEPEARDAIARQIARYGGEFPQAQILVTSRLIGYPGRILREAGFGQWLLADFDQPKIDTFLNHWLEDGIREPGDRPQIRQRMANALRSPVIRELAGNPLLLTLMVVLARKSDLPRDLASLYVRASELLLEQWDTHRLLAADVRLGEVIIDQKDKRDLLRDLAWKMQTGQRGLRGNLIASGEVESAMDAAFKHRIPDPGLRRKAIALLIEQLVERNYILCHIGGAQFGFVHRGFLEFFASEHLVHIVTQRPETAIGEIGEIYQTYAGSDAWREVLILAASRFDPAVADKILLPLANGSELKEALMEFFGGRPHPFTLVCAVIARVREPHKLEATTAYVRSELSRWIRDNIEDAYGDDGVRLLATTFPDEVTRGLLVKLVGRNENARARTQAAASLAQAFPDEATRALLVELARRSEDTRARAQAAASLAQVFPDEATRALLVELAGRNEDTEARVQAVASLAQAFPDEATRALLVELARRSEDTRAGTQAVTSLARAFPDEATRTLLVELVGRNEDTRARARAVESLAYSFRDETTRALLVELAGGYENARARARAQAVKSLRYAFPKGAS